MLNLKSKNYNLNLKTNLKYRAYQFSLRAINLINSFPNKRIYWVIGDQLLRAATSIGANIIEAQASSTRKEFINYYAIALKSANETKYWLCLLRDCNLEDKGKISEILKEAEEIGNMLGSSLLTLRGKNF